MALLLGCSRDASPAPLQRDRHDAAVVTVPVTIVSSARLADSGPPTVAAAAPPKNCNVILLSIDSLRADMPWSGYQRPIAPRLTALESQAVSFTRAYSVSSYTSMSLGGLLGGRLPSELHRSGYFFGTYRGDLFFPKLLQRAGVHTMGVMAHGYFRSAGFDQGFDEWTIVPGITFDASTDRDVTSPQSEQLSEQLLGEPANDTRPFFFWVHFLDPHDLYMRHDGIDWGKGPRDRYDGEVTFTDQYVGKLLEFVASKPWGSRTVVFITSDHGEEFGEHNMTRHGFEIWETLVHVPLIVVAPGAQPRRIDTAHSNIDLAPTIVDLFGLPPDPSWEGASLSREIYGMPTEAREVVVDLPMTSDNGKRRALLRGTKKLICFGDAYCRLYDVVTDPLEREPVTGGEEFQQMRDRYRTLAKTIREIPPYGCFGDCLNGGYRRKQGEK
jgi:arylsulfatase A-like enzyme